MTRDEIQMLYRYNAWANARILDTSARLSPEQLLASCGASFDSVRDTLVHTLGAQWLYLERWQGRSPDRKSTRLNSSHSDRSRMPSSA